MICPICGMPRTFRLISRPLYRGCPKCFTYFRPDLVAKFKEKEEKKMTDIKTTLAGGGTLAVPIICWCLERIGIKVPNEVVIGGMAFFAALMGWLAKDKTSPAPTP